MTEEDLLIVGRLAENRKINFSHYGDNEKRIWPLVSIVFFIMIGFTACLEALFVVQPGMVGIVVTMGKVQSYSSGLHYRIPFVSTLEFLSTKTQLLEEQNIIPTKEGLSVTLDTAILFQLDPTMASHIYSTVGSDYISVVVRPESASAVRGLTSESEAKALYSSGRTVIQDALKEDLKDKLGPRGIIVEDVLLKDIILPDQLSRAIEQKVRAEQEAARMEFVLRTEQQEAQRKAIEASGIADFQKIVSEGISEELLQWKGVEATEKFATSPNTKIVIIGNSNSDLPVILSAANDDST